MCECERFASEFGLTLPPDGASSLSRVIKANPWSLFPDRSADDWADDVARLHNLIGDCHL